MPRPVKCRKICSMPKSCEFRPVNVEHDAEGVIMTVDEYETIRLIDKCDFSQSECSEYMEIARTTVQQIYNSARQKIAEALVEGVPLKIQGGEYRLCDGTEEYCECGGCLKHREAKARKIKKEGKMIVAIPLDENKESICVTFARAPYIMFADGKDVKILENPAAQAQGGAGPKAAQFIVDNEADALITVRCGENAAEVLKLAELKIYKNDGENAKENVEKCQKGELKELTHFHAGYHGVQ